MPFDPWKPAIETPTETVYRERLCALADLLETIDDRAFDLRDWQRNGSCDSVACAVGWALRDDWFRNQGLVRDDRSPGFRGLKGWRAVRTFFGLNREEAFYLFHAGKYDDPTREAVLDRVRRFAATR